MLTPRNPGRIITGATVWSYMASLVYMIVSNPSLNDFIVLLSMFILSLFITCKSRSLEPLEGFEQMRELRSVRRKDGGVKLKEKDLCNGPSKLCDALSITKEEINQLNLSSSELIWLEGYAYLQGLMGGIYHKRK